MRSDDVSPELVEVLAARVVEADPHLQAVGHHEVKRPQHAIKAGEHAQVGLGEVEVGLAEIFYGQTGVDVPLEGQQRLAGVGRREVRLPLGKAGGVEAGELVADLHQAGDLVRAQLTSPGDQCCGVVQQFGLGETGGHQG